MNMSGFDLNLLKILDALLREGSTVRAADRVGLSQPAVSAALGRLRHALNDPLFVRQGKGLVPTDYARQISVSLRQTLDGIEALLNGRQAFDPATASQSFRLSGSDFFAEMLLPDLALYMAEHAPGIRVQLIDLVPQSYVATLERDTVDLALVPATNLPDWADSRPVFHASFCVAARRGHDALKQAGILTGMVIPLDLFCDLDHVLFSPEGNLQAMGDAALAAVGRERRVAMTLPVFSGVARAISKSDLIGLLPTSLANRLAPTLGLAVYKAPMPLPVALMRMIWHRRSSANPAHCWLRDVIATMLLPLNVGHPPLPADIRA